MQSKAPNWGIVSFTEEPASAVGVDVLRLLPVTFVEIGLVRSERELVLTKHTMDAVTTCLQALLESTVTAS